MNLRDLMTKCVFETLYPARLPVAGPEEDGARTVIFQGKLLQLPARGHVWGVALGPPPGALTYHEEHTTLIHWVVEYDIVRRNVATPGYTHRLWFLERRDTWENLNNELEAA